MTVGQPGFVKGGGGRGKSREQSDRAGESVGGGIPPPTEGRFFENLCMKTTFSCTLKSIIRGSLCSGIDQFPFFHINLSQGNIFSFFFSFFRPPPQFFSFFWSSVRQGGGGGGCSLPPAPLPLGTLLI